MNWVYLFRIIGHSLQWKFTHLRRPCLYNCIQFVQESVAIKYEGHLSKVKSSTLVAGSVIASVLNIKGQSITTYEIPLTKF